MITHTKIYITHHHDPIKTNIFSTLRSYVQYANPRFALLLLALLPVDRASWVPLGVVTLPPWFTLLLLALLPVDRASWVPLGMVTLPEDALKWARVKYTRSA